MAEQRSFGRYRVTGTLGAGAMGEVYAAVDDALGREVAVKTLRASASGLAARILDVRFRQEARAIAALRHPGVVQVFDLDLAADPPYLVMERVAGPTLKERLAAGPLDVAALRVVGIQIGRALAAAHAVGVVHRDVKPANILGDGEATWKLADFGVAHVPDSSLTITGQFVGSPAYAPPEALVRGVAGAPGDVYGLGATLYEAAVGRWPRFEAAAGALLAPLPPVRDLAPGLPAELAAVIDRAVAVEPGDRPSATELADAVAGGCSPRAVGAVALPASGPGVASWRPWVAGGAVVLAIALIAYAQRAAPGGPDGAPAGLSDAVPAVRPTELRIAEPSGLDPRQARDWRKLVDELVDGRYEEARHKLDEFEHHWGTLDETRALRGQLDALGPDAAPRHGKAKGKGKKHDD